MLLNRQWLFHVFVVLYFLMAGVLADRLAMKINKADPPIEEELLKFIQESNSNYCNNCINIERIEDP